MKFFYSFIIKHPVVIRDKIVQAIVTDGQYSEVGLALLVSACITYTSSVMLIMFELHNIQQMGINAVD